MKNLNLSVLAFTLILVSMVILVVEKPSAWWILLVLPFFLFFRKPKEASDESRVVENKVEEANDEAINQVVGVKYSKSAIISFSCVVASFFLGSFIGLVGIGLFILTSLFFSIFGWREIKAIPSIKGKGLIIATWIVMGFMVLFLILGFIAAANFRVI